MNLYKSADSFDFGVINIENLFIEQFMPYCSKIQLQVYLAGKKLIDTKQNANLNDISLILNISIDEIKDAFKYWELKGIVKIANISEERFDVSYISIRDIYLKSNYSINQISTSVDSSYEYKNLLKQIDDKLAVPLNEIECQNLISFLKNIEIDDSLVIEAFLTTKRRKYRVLGANELITHWIENDIKNIEDLNAFNERYNLRNLNYKKILTAMGYPYRNPSAGEKEVIDKWFDEFNLEIDFIIEKITDITRKKRDPSMNYYDAVMINTTNENKDKRKSSNLTEKELEEIFGAK